MVDPTIINYPLLIRSASYYWPGEITGYEWGYLFGLRMVTYLWGKTLPNGEKVWLATTMIERDYE